MELVLFVLLQVASSSSTSQSDVKDYATIGHWQVAQSFDNDVCLASTTYVPKTGIIISLRPRKNSLRIWVTDPILASLKDGEKYDIELDFIRNNKLDRGWGTVHSRGEYDSAGVPGFSFGLEAEAALKDISSSQTIGFMYNDKVVESLKLTESANMVTALKKCASEIVKHHPIDPFES